MGPLGPPSIVFVRPSSALTRPLTRVEHSTTSASTPRTDRASMCGRNSDHDPCKQHRATHTILCAHAPAQQLAWLRRVARRCIRAQRRLPWEEYPACARVGALRPPCDHTRSLRGGCNHRPPRIPPELTSRLPRPGESRAGL